MRKKRAIKRFFLTLMWLGVGIGMGTVITAAMRVQETGVCKGYDIKIEGFKKDMLFTSEEQIAALLKAATKGDITGQRKSEFNLPVIEDLLEQSAWVYNADLYFDNNNLLHAHVTERKPLARIFTSQGASFYMDEAGRHIPLSDKISLDLPVFTGYPAKKIMNSKDSVLIQNIIATASFISSDPFWNAQVAQIDINSCGADCWSMEMIPVVGSHKVDLGDGSDIVSKFHRLYLFYDQVLKRTGFDKYRKIDVQYNGQVIGVKGNYTKVDSIQLRKNIEYLLQQSREYNEMVQVAAPAANYASLSKEDTTLSADEIYGAVEPADSTLFMNDSEDKPEVEKDEVAAALVVKKPEPLKAAKPVTKAEEKAAPKTPDKKEAKPVAAKPAVVKTSEKKPVPVKTIEKKSEKKATAKKTDTKAPATKKAAPAKTTPKVEARKPVVKKVEEKEVKRNVLLNPGPVKKAVEKTTPAKKKETKKSG